MEVITFEAQAYKELVAKINTIAKFVITQQNKEDETPVDSWVDSYEVCTFLKISSRTLQRLRTARQINYSQIRGKNYYRISEIERLMNDNIIRRSDDCLQDLIKNHKLHVEQRRDIKKDK
jgi:hypothetical protein